ncbi:putative tetratricopeptide-like helical domain superfamily [Helianthus anomalus]
MELTSWMKMTRFQTFWIQMQKNKSLDESRKTSQTSETKMAIYSNLFIVVLTCADNQEELVNDSTKHTKEAIALNVKDGNPWYNLGNACLTCFFVTGAWDHSKLQQSLKSYQNAEKDESMKLNPDLDFNCATVNTYLENYERALSGFEAAASIDP